MTLEQLCRLRAMGNHVGWELLPEDVEAIAAAIEGMPNPRLVQALEAVLMFYSGGPWDAEMQLRWAQLTSGFDPWTGRTYHCTSKGLCDFIRQRLAEPFGEKVQPIVKDVANA